MSSTNSIMHPVDHTVNEFRPFVQGVTVYDAVGYVVYDRVPYESIFPETDSDQDVNDEVLKWDIKQKKFVKVDPERAKQLSNPAKPKTTVKPRFVEIDPEIHVYNPENPETFNFDPDNLVIKITTKKEVPPPTVDHWHNLAGETFSVGDSVWIWQLGRSVAELCKAMDDEAVVTEFRLCKAAFSVGMVEYRAIVRFKNRKHGKSLPVGLLRLITEPMPTQEHESLTDELALATTIYDLIQENLTDAEITSSLTALSKNTGVPFHQLDRQYRERVAAIEQAEDLTEQADELNDLLKVTKTLDLHQIFPEALAKALITKAEASRIDPAHLLQTLLPCIGVMVGANACIVVKEGATWDDTWKEYPINWTVNVADPSTGKSVAQSAITSALKKLERDARQRHKEKSLELKKLQKAWDLSSDAEKKALLDSEQNPEVFERDVMGTRRRYLFNEATFESLMKRTSEQAPHTGVGCIIDELLGFFTGVDQHKSGKGNSRQRILSAWNGPLTETVDRVNEADSFDFDHQTLCIGGGLQPAVVAKIYDLENDGDGLLSRVLPAVPEIPADFDQWSDVTVDVHTLLLKLYENLELLQGNQTQCRFTPDAHKLYIQATGRFKRGLVKWLREGNAPLGYFLGKMPIHLARLTLALHLVEWSLDTSLDIETVSLKTVERASGLTSFYIGQFRLLQARAGKTSREAMPALHLKIYEYIKGRDKTTVRDVTKRFSREKITTRKALDILQSMKRLLTIQSEGKAISDFTIVCKNAGEVSA